MLMRSVVLVPTVVRTGLLAAGLVATALFGAGLVAPVGAAHADTGCVATPLGDSAPVYERADTTSTQINTITNASPGRGCQRTGGAAYTACGESGTTWVYVRNKAGFTPRTCVELAE